MSALGETAIVALRRLESRQSIVLARDRGRFVVKVHLSVVLDFFKIIWSDGGIFRQLAASDPDVD